MTTKLWALALAAGIAWGAPAPAHAESFEPDADMAYALEAVQWTAPAGGFGFNAFMHTVTLTDRTGTVLALVNSATRTNANRYYAEQDAIRQRQAFYTYQQVIDEPKEGVRLSLILGTGSPNGLYGAGASQPADLDAKLARLRMAADIVGLLGGTLGFHSGLSYFQANGSGFSFTSLAFPLGLSWRIAPLPVPGLVFEPFADFDWVTALGRRFAYDTGLRVTYHMHPSFALTGRAELARWAADAPGAAKGLADARVGAIGAMLLF